MPSSSRLVSRVRYGSISVMNKSEIRSTQFERRHLQCSPATTKSDGGGILSNFGFRASNLLRELRADVRRDVYRLDVVRAERAAEHGGDRTDRDRVTALVGELEPVAHRFLPDLLQRDRDRQH